jgi:hypothetical protein
LHPQAFAWASAPGGVPIDYHPIQGFPAQAHRFALRRIPNRLPKITRPNDKTRQNPLTVTALLT